MSIPYSRQRRERKADPKSLEPDPIGEWFRDKRKDLRDNGSISSRKQANRYNKRLAAPLNKDQ